MARAIRLLHRPGADLGPAMAAAEAAGLSLSPVDLSPEGGLSAAQSGDIVLVAPRAGTRAGDAYQLAAAAAMARGVRVIEVSDKAPGAEPNHPGPANAEAVVAGFGDAGWAIAIDLIAASA